MSSSHPARISPVRRRAAGQKIADRVNAARTGHIAGMADVEVVREMVRVFTGMDVATADNTLSG